MQSIRIAALGACLLACLGTALAAQEPDEAADAPAAPLVAQEKIDEIVEKTRKSVVVITYTGRDGEQEGLGSGFVVSPEGLIATNHHVIGEARPIRVQLSDGRKFDVTEVHASDRPLDLAIVRIEPDEKLPALELGDSGELKQGQPVVGLGNPLGLEYSVVTGVVSGIREVEEREMIQLAIPIERGNSGGPVVDLQGRAVGLLTLKSQRAANLGFAMPVNTLKAIIESPNPIPMERWLTIGALDPREWVPLFGARWRQRAGRIMVEGASTGFFGRSLCLYQEDVPERPYEVSAAVHLEDEAGAAGLVLESDGEHKHYGFYPSAGKLRFTRFDGPTVYSWQVLHDKRSDHYVPGDWNTLKVRVEEKKILCYVNDHLVFETADNRFRDGRVGLAKFRNTRAEFRKFRLGKQVPPAGVSDEARERITGLVDDLPLRGPLPEEVVGSLVPEADDSLIVLRKRARNLRREADRLLELAREVHEERVLEQLADAVSQPDDQIDLFHAALLLAKLDNDEVDVASYRKELERIARDIREGLPEKADEAARIAALNKYLFRENGFHGSRSDYYSRANSYMNEVLDDREGLPITLSVLYMELAARLDLEVVGVPLPGHFVVRHVPAEGEGQLIDVYDGGKPLSRDQAAEKVQKTAGVALTDEHLAAATKRDIVIRMLNNLRGIAERRRDADGMLRYLDAILAIDSEDAGIRWYRAVLRFQFGRPQDAREDVDWLLENSPPGIDLRRVHELKNLLDRAGDE